MTKSTLSMNEKGRGMYVFCRMKAAAEAISFRR